MALCRDCNAGYRRSGDTCVACSSNTFHGPADMATVDNGTPNTCKTCSSCKSGSTYRTTLCTTIADTQCTPCRTKCPAGSYLSGTCTAESDTPCSTCATICPLNSRLALQVTCTGEFNYDQVLQACVPCILPNACPAGEYLNRQCPGTDYTANSCLTCDKGACPAGQYRTGCGGYNNSYCVAYRSCLSNQYLEDETSTQDGVCRDCTVCPSGLERLRDCSRYEDTVCRGDSCGTRTPCPRRTTQNTSSYFCDYAQVNDRFFCGVCPPGYDSDGQYCLECPRGVSCDRVGQPVCRGQCKPGFLTTCGTLWSIGYAECDTPCEVPSDNGTRRAWRGSYVPAEARDCATYFLCRPGYYKKFSTGGTVECNDCTERRPTKGQYDLWVTSGLSIGDGTSCLWECDRRLARWNGTTCVPRAGGKGAENAAGYWAGGACGLGKTSEALTAVSAAECLDCKPLIGDSMQWLGLTKECAWECTRSNALKRGGACVVRRTDCLAEGWSRDLGDPLFCVATSFPWNRPGYAKTGWMAPVVGTHTQTSWPSGEVTLSSQGYGFTGRHKVTVSGWPARLVEGGLCSATRMWVRNQEYVFAAPCNQSFLVYLDVASGDGLGVLIGQADNPGWADGFRTQAQFETELYVASGGNGTLYVLDTWNCLLREVEIWDRPGSYLTRVYTLWGNQDKLVLVPPQPKCYGSGALAWPRRFWVLQDGWLAFTDEDGLWQFHTETRDLIVMIKESTGGFEADALLGLDTSDRFTLKLYFQRGVLWDLLASQAGCLDGWTSRAGGDCSVSCPVKDATGVAVNYVERTTGSCLACPQLACGVGQAPVECTSTAPGYCRTCPPVSGMRYSQPGSCEASTLRLAAPCNAGHYTSSTGGFCEPCPPYTTTLYASATRFEQCKCLPGLARRNGVCVGEELYDFESACAQNCRVPQKASRTTNYACRWECNAGYYRDPSAGLDDQCRPCLSGGTRTKGDDASPWSCE